MTLRFIHLSDIHFGQEKQGSHYVNEDARAELLRDCRKMLEKGIVKGPATGVLITGDVAYAGTESEFKTAAIWLDELTAAVGCGRRSIQVIPGNHDVDLKALGHDGHLVQDQLRTQDPERVQAFLNQISSDENNILMRKLTDYRSFAGAYGSDFLGASQPISIKEYNLEGGKGIRIVGLCSVILSDRKDAVGNMFLGQSQYVVNRSESHEDVVMVHHPLHWYMDRGLAEPYLHNRARLLMTGHEHTPDFAVIRRHEDFEQTHIAAGATTPPSANAEYTFTYNWIEFSWSQLDGRSILNVEIYPRKWERLRTVFDTDYGRTGGQQSRRLALDCGPAPKAGAAGRQKSNLEPDISVKVVGDQASELTDMPETNPVPEQVINREDYETLRFLFWRYLDRTQRQRTLVEAGLLPSSGRSLPPAFERHAFEQAKDEATLRLIWDETMKHVPDNEKQENRF